MRNVFPHFYPLWKCHCAYPKGRCRENVPPAPSRFILSCYAWKRMLLTAVLSMNGPTRSTSSLCPIHSSFSSSLHWIPTGNMGMPEAVNSSQYSLTVCGISGGRQHSVDMRKNCCKVSHFILGQKENWKLLYIKLCPLTRSCTPVMKEEENTLLMTCFCRFNLEFHSWPFCSFWLQ